MTRGAWPALPLFTEHVTARTHLDIGAEPTHRLGLSLAAPLARSDARGRGGGCADAYTHTHTGAFVCAAATAPQHSFGRQSTPSPRDPRSHLVLVTTMARWTATTSNGSKSFDPKSSSTRVVPGPEFMTNPHHTQKTDSEPSGMRMIMQKSYSPDVRLVITFMMMTNNTHIRLPRHALKNRPRPG